MGEHVQLEGVLSHQALAELSRVKFVRVHQPLKWSYGYAKSPAFVKSMEFARLIEGAVGIPVRISYTNIACFEKGDYTVLYDALKPARGFVFFLDVFSLDESCGGFTSFVGKTGEMVRVVPKRNVLSIIKADGLRFFTKYVNHHAKSPRVFLIGVALPK